MAEMENNLQKIEGNRKKDKSGQVQQTWQGEPADCREGGTATYAASGQRLSPYPRWHRWYPAQWAGTRWQGVCSVHRSVSVGSVWVIFQNHSYTKTITFPCRQPFVSPCAILSANFIHIIKTVKNALHIPHKKCYNHCEKIKKEASPMDSCDRRNVHMTMDTDYTAVSSVRKHPLLK